MMYIPATVQLAERKETIFCCVAPQQKNVQSRILLKVQAIQAH